MNLHVSQVWLKQWKVCSYPPSPISTPPIHPSQSNRGALCRSMGPNFNVPNTNVLHINSSLLQPWVVEVQSTLALPKALKINGSKHQRIKTLGRSSSLLVSLLYTKDIWNHFSKKAVELNFLVLPCLKSDIQRPLESNNGTISEMSFKSWNLIIIYTKISQEII